MNYVFLKNVQFQAASHGFLKLEFLFCLEVKNWRCVYILSISGTHRAKANEGNTYVSMQAGKGKSDQKILGRKNSFCLFIVCPQSLRNLPVLYNDQNTVLFSFLFPIEHCSYNEFVIIKTKKCILKVFLLFWKMVWKYAKKIHVFLRLKFFWGSNSGKIKKHLRNISRVRLGNR